MSDKCGKCGAYNLSTQYDQTTDRLQKTCLKCGFGWTEEPLDKRSEAVHEDKPGLMPMNEGV